ncbi:MAG: hypothetical protein HYS38_01230 [Acidobacteria bacterium]|nr:hypothetical protein [Acidobacteriota bacterium]
MMSFESAYSARNCIERLRHATERFEVVSRSLGDIADDFLKYDSLSQGKPVEQILIDMANKLPEPFLVRALAEEGLALIEQIEWEAYIYKHSPEASRKPDQSSALSAVAEAVQEQKAFLEQTIDKMNSLIQLAMDAPNQLSDIVASLKNALESKTE